ncbi:MAG: ornithine cyclodeaminase family protein [Bacteroidaceae bacterium]|nr:ornithine cyclodeaminase family protein [Bacteroidaceae bacterium]
MSRINIKVISQEEVFLIFEKAIDSVIDLVEDAFRKYESNNVIFPDKISQIFDQSSQNRINCMPATLLDERVCGLKWVSVFPTNAIKGVQNVTGAMILSEIETGFPIAFIDGTYCTKLRTSAVGCVAAKYLAPSVIEKIGIIGGGEEAKMHFALLKHFYPSIKECRVSSRSFETEKKFIDTFKDIVNDVNFVACEGSSKMCAEDVDIIITAISGQAPVLKASDITKGCLYIHVGGWEDEYGVALKADKIVCDDWEASKHRTQTICRMYKNGLLSDSDIYANLSDLILNKKKSRENDEEFIYFNSVGLSFIDLNFANYIYKQALKCGLGSDIVLAETNYIDYSKIIF